MLAFSTGVWFSPPETSRVIREVCSVAACLAGEFCGACMVQAIGDEQSANVAKHTGANSRNLIRQYSILYAWPGLVKAVPSLFSMRRSEEHTSELQSLRHLV